MQPHPLNMQPFAHVMHSIEPIEHQPDQHAAMALDVATQPVATAHNVWTQLTLQQKYDWYLAKSKALSEANGYASVPLAYDSWLGEQDA